MTKAGLSLGAAICWLIISTVLLTLPGSSLPKEDWFDRLWIDKWVHIGMFALLVILWNRAMRKRIAQGKKLRSTFLWFGIGGLLYGVLMECIQYRFIPFRSFDWGDIVADAAGCCLGIVYSLVRYIKK